MIKANFLPPTDTPLLTVGWCRAMIRRARKSTAKIIQNARKTAAKSCRTIRDRAYARGYSAGREDAQRAFFALTSHAQSLADDWRRQHRNECAGIAFALAEQVIGIELTERKEIYQPWLMSALDMLPPSEALKLHYHPDQRFTINDLVTDYSVSIDLVEDPTLQLGEISLRSATGGVDFSWRHALEVLRESSPRGER